MEQKHLEEIVLKSVFFARYFTDTEGPNLDKCIEKSINRFRESAEKSREATASGKNGGLAGGMHNMIQYVKEKLAYRKNEKKHTPLRTRLPQMRQEAQYFLNEVGNFYSRDKEREHYAKDIKEYIMKLYSMDAKECFGWMEKQQKGLSRMSLACGAGAGATILGLMHYANNMPKIASMNNAGDVFQAGSNQLVVFPLTALALGLLAGAGIALYRFFQTGSELKTVKKIYEETAKEKAYLEQTADSQLQEVMLDKKNKARIGYMKEAGFTEMRRLLTNYKAFEKRISFTEILDNFMG